MKNSLVALVIICASASPLAHGQIANVRLYGDLNLDFELVRGRQQDESNPTINRLSSNSSRFGIRGDEYLGRGQVAIFQIESSINGDTNGGNLGGRETYVGLQGDWGTVKLGRYLTPYDDILPIFGNAPTLTTSILSTAAIWAQGPLSKVQGGFDARLGNSIRYETPPLGGFTGEIQYSTRDSSGNADGADNGDHASELRHANVIGVGAFYSKGPLDLGAAYERNRDVRFANTTDDAWSIAAAYDVGALVGSTGVRVGAVYERLRYDTPTGDLKRDFWGISATVPAGGGSIYAFWGHAANGKGEAADGTTIGALTKGPDSACDQWELSYSYPLSLRTLLYAGYVRLDNRANASYGFNINDYSTARGSKPTGYVFGMAHFF
ncbi:MAG TPA: porin [Casimicrobiaceae bacterium]|nr:porin [Casimicrobiaceae bacterium]